MQGYNRSWAAPTLDRDQDAILEALENNVPVRLMATVGNLVAAQADERARDALARASEGGFDYLPVRNGHDGPIVGLFSREDALDSKNKQVKDIMKPLSVDNLIGANAPLLQFVYGADQSPCRLLLGSTEICGIVTLSDMQRIPVRTAIFGLFIHLELVLTEALERMLGSNCPFELLSEKHPKRADEARSRWKEAKNNNMDQNKTNSLQFTDKKLLLMKLNGFGISATQIDRKLGLIERHLRDPIAHGSQYAATRDGALTTVKATKLVRDWIKIVRSNAAT